jgi:iron complex transport system ATP-binding protein
VTRLVLEHVSVDLGGRPVLHDIRLSLGGASLVALLGPNGAGKSTVLKAIAGLLPSAGQISIEGKAVDRMPSNDRARNIGYLPQGHQVFWPLPAREIVALGRFPHGVSDPARLDAGSAAIIDAAMARTDCRDFADRPVTALSGGERARVMLARALAIQAPILLADEPTAALDPRHQIAVMRELAAEARAGALVIAATHDIALASRLADAVILMDKGRIVAHGAPAEVLTDQRIREVFGVEAIHPEIAGQRVVLPWSLPEDVA